MEEEREVKRTYLLTEEEVKVIDALSDSTPLNRSQIVGRMVRNYYLQLRDGELDDPMITDQMADQFEGAMDSERQQSLLEKARDRLGD